MQLATVALQILNFIKMKALTKDEMKKVMGGNEYWHPATVYCNETGYSVASLNDCSNSEGVCNGHGGFKTCLAGGYWV